MRNSDLQSRKYSLKRNSVKGLQYFCLILVGIICLFPLVWILLNSLKNNAEIFASPFSLPKTLNFNNYINAWKTANVGTYFINSILVSFSAVILIVLLASMASYILARIWPNKLIQTYFVLGLMIPIHAMLIPTFIMLRDINLYNTRRGLIVVYCAVNLSLSIFILTGFMKNIPKEIEESARMDGAGIYRIFFKIIMPISKPGIATIATLSFLNAWNDFLYAQVLISNPALKTLTQGIANLKGQYATDYGLMSSGLVIAIIPVSLIYILFQEQVIKGMTAGAVKG